RRGPGRVRAGLERARRACRLRRRRSEGDAARDLADAGRRVEAARGVADAGAGGGGRVAAARLRPRHPVVQRRGDRAASAGAQRRRTFRRGVALTRMLGSDAILRALEAEGVDIAFGIPGGAILPTYDAMARGTTVRHVLARHEQGAGHMAEGY